MKSMIGLITLLSASAFYFAKPAFAEDEGSRGNPPPIPEAAYTACSGKSVGDVVSDGQMSGTCELAPDGKLALRPNGPPPNGTPPSDGRAPSSISDGTQVAR